jgi:hypothetical protein
MISRIQKNVRLIPVQWFSFARTFKKPVLNTPIQTVDTAEDVLKLLAEF